jgi:hypothetical protein
MTRDPRPDEEPAKRIMEQVPQEPIAADPSENDEAEDRPEADDEDRTRVRACQSSKTPAPA